MEYILTHSGIKGMKWGVRRYQNKDGSLTPAGIKRYARKGFAEDSYNSNKTKFGKAWDKVTNAHKYGGDAMYGVSSEKQRKARAEKYVVDQKAKKEAKREVNREKLAKAAGKGAKVVGKMAMLSLTDDIFYGGAGKKVVKETVKQTGRAVITAYLMARGHYDIRWYDN